MPTKVTTALDGQTGQITSSERGRANGESAAIYLVLAIFGVLLALITSKHEIYFDEAQAWLIARDSHSLFDLFHALHYEAHPALWYLLLFIPAHISSSIMLMQCINYALAITMAWLILFSRNLPLQIRILLVFGLSIFFTMGVLARSYMLAGVLLIAAARCLSVRPQRHWLAMALLALAINAHFFAVPVAVCVFVWLYWLAPISSWSAAAALLKLRVSAAIIALAVIACYLTVRPAPDIVMPFPITGASDTDYLVLAVGRVWHYFAPFASSTRSLPIGQSLLTLSAFGDAALTIAFWGVSLSVLPGRRSRWFMISASLLWVAAVVATVHIPRVAHCSFLVVAYVIALSMRTNRAEDRSWLPDYAAHPVLVIILATQVSLCLDYCIQEWQKPFSGAKATAEWLKAAGLSHRPLVIQPELSAPTLIAYLGVKSAYLPNCSCNHSFVVYRPEEELKRLVTVEELRELQNKFGAAPVLISQWKPAPADLERLGMRLLYTSPNGWAWDNENVFVYGSAGEALREASEAAR